MSGHQSNRIQIESSAIPASYSTVKPNSKLTLKPSLPSQTHWFAPLSTQSSTRSRGLLGLCFVPEESSASPAAYPTPTIDNIQLSISQIDLSPSLLSTHLFHDCCTNIFTIAVCRRLINAVNLNSTQDANSRGTN